MRLPDLLRVALGAACLAAPGAVLAGVGDPDPGAPGLRAITRVLGARYVAHAGADALVGLPRLGPAVELTHAASMLPVAVVAPRHRRTALVSAGAALGLAALDLRGR